MVSTSLVMVSTFLVMVATSLVMVGGSSKTTVAHKCSGAMEIQKYDQLTDGLTWVGARDTCVSKQN